MLVQCIARIFIRSRNSTVDAERIGNQRMSKQAAFDFRERQHANNGAVSFRQQVVCAMAESFLNDGFPARTMEKRGFRTGFDKGVPFSEVGVTEQCDRGAG